MRLATPWPTRGLVLAVVGAIAMAAAMRECEPTPVAMEQWIGMVEHQTLVRDVKGNYQFELAVEWPTREERVVRYRGVLPDTVCEGAEVFVRGRLAPRGYIEAAELLGRAPSKYDPCAAYFCHRETAPQECRHEVIH